MVSIGPRRTMKAVVCQRPASPGELEIKEFDRPAVPDDGLLVRILASSANPVDLFALSPVGHLLRRRRPVVVGTDFAGIVEATGKNVTAFEPGDEVLGAGRGSFAEYIGIAASGGVVRKPAGVSFEDAATLPVAASTALQALRDHGRVQSGQRVIVNGASGGVGTFAVQIARSLGAEVTAVCSTRNVDLVGAIGAGTVIDYTRDDFTRTGERYDLMLDVAGNRSWSECTRVLAKGATYVGVGAAGVQHGKGGSRAALTHFLEVRLASIGSGRRVVPLFIAKLRKDDLEFLGRLVESGRVKPVIDKRYDLADVADALAHIEMGHLRGKLVILIGQ
jgi:NADPH:quinone reductase-like Zn-dependent oxidoreductase